MNDTAILVDGISKRYTIGKSQARYSTFRDTLAEGVRAPFRRISRWRRGDHADEADLERTIWALKDVSFEVKRGEVVGIIGRNGAGKSTLLKILAQITEPTEGSVDLYGRVGSLLEVGTGFHAELTGRENIYLNGAILGMRRVEIDRKFDEIVAFSEVEKFIDTPVKHYSSGMYLRLAFAVAAHLEPEILLVDEVLAVGDAQFQKKCLGKMDEVAHEGRTVLFVSHNMDAIISLCPRTMVVDDGRVAYLGETEQAVKIYLGNLNPQDEHTEAHILYQDGDQGAHERTAITCIEALDKDLQPKSAIYTWEDVILRVHYHAVEEVLRGQFVLDIRDYKQQRLVVLDSGPKLPVRAGQHYVDCHIPRLPLSAGDYYLGAGIAVARSEWLWRETHLAQFRIFSTDVFEIGRAPIASRMAVAVEHAWEEAVLEHD